MLLVSVDKYPSKEVIVSSGSVCVHESAKNELKEDNNGFGYLFDVIINWIFYKNMNVTEAATPPAKWSTHGYFANQIYRY